MPKTEAQLRASAAYQKKMDNIVIRPTKDEGQRIRDAAKAAGMSTQAYILEVLRERMERDAQNPNTTTP